MENTKVSPEMDTEALPASRGSLFDTLWEKLESSSVGYRWRTCIPLLQRFGFSGYYTMILRARRVDEVAFSGPDEYRPQGLWYLRQGTAALGLAPFQTRVR